MEIFESFNNGKLALTDKTINFSEIEWSKHPTFAGVELKHIVTANDTNGQFSYHLVRISPNCSIKEHTHENQLETHEVIKGNGICINSEVSIDYQIGTISIIPAGIKHEVIAGENGLYLFAKFIPALC